MKKMTNSLTQKVMEINGTYRKVPRKFWKEMHNNLYMGKLKGNNSNIRVRTASSNIGSMDLDVIIVRAQQYNYMNLSSRSMIS